MSYCFNLGIKVKCEKCGREFERSIIWQDSLYELDLKTPELCHDCWVWYRLFWSFTDFGKLLRKLV